jgi:hypothetical protein
MEEKKISNSAAIKLRRAKQLGGLALADSYPQTHSGDAAHVKRIEDPSPPSTPPPLRRRLPPDPRTIEGIAIPWKKPVGK